MKIVKREQAPQIRCDVCGYEFEPDKKNRYEVPIRGFMELNTRVNECFDCPKCGCQIMVNERYIPPIVVSKKEESNEH